jgi:hypothetical protein
LDDSATPALWQKTSQTEKVAIGELAIHCAELPMCPPQLLGNFEPAVALLLARFRLSERESYHEIPISFC